MEYTHALIQTDWGVFAFLTLGRRSQHDDAEVHTDRTS